MDNGQFVAVLGATAVYTFYPFADVFVTMTSTLTFIQNLGAVLVNQSMTAILSDTVAMGSTLTDSAS